MKEEFDYLLNSFIIAFEEYMEESLIAPSFT